MIEAQISFSFLGCKFLADLIERHLIDRDRLQHCSRTASAVTYGGSATDFRLLSLLDWPACRGLQAT